MTEDDYLIGPNKVPVQEINVIVNATLSKYDTLEVDDYTVNGFYDDGSPCINYGSCNLLKNWKNNRYTLKEALDLAVELAQKVYVSTKDDALKKEAVKVFNACEGWGEEDFEVNLD